VGEVYRAADPGTGRDVAIKVSAERFSDRFSPEVHAVAALNHSNVYTPTLHKVGENYFIMELIEGPTLAERSVTGPSTRVRASLHCATPPDNAALFSDVDFLSSAN
jgi:serine/threonine protein kinase